VYATVHDRRRVRCVTKYCEDNELVLGFYKVVIKSLDTSYHSVDGISGATILGDGKVSLILDITKLQDWQGEKFKAKVLEAA